MEKRVARPLPSSESSRSTLPRTARTTAAQALPQRLPRRSSMLTTMRPRWDHLTRLLTTTHWHILRWATTAWPRSARWTTATPCSTRACQWRARYCASRLHSALQPVLAPTMPPHPAPYLLPRSCAGPRPSEARAATGRTVRRNQSVTALPHPNAAASCSLSA